MLKKENIILSCYFKTTETPSSNCVVVGYQFPSSATSQRDKETRRQGDRGPTEEMRKLKQNFSWRLQRR